MLMGYAMHVRESCVMAETSRWHPGRLLLGWALGVLTTIGLVTLVGGWYEYRALSTALGSGSSARRLTTADTACLVDRSAAIEIGGFEVVPGQTDPCYLRRPRIRPWQWADGLRELLGRLSGASAHDTNVGAPITRRFERPFLRVEPSIIRDRPSPRDELDVRAQAPRERS